MNYTKTSWENDITPVSAENMNKIENQLKALTDAIYPVGSIYMSMSSTNPSNLFGGTWERIGVGRTLVSAGGDANAVLDENNYTGRGTNTAETHWFPVGETGGEFSHTLTTTEMPSHGHSGNGWTFSVYKGTRSSETVGGISGSGFLMTQVKAGGSWGGYGSVPAAGGGGGHNNMSTYLAVYMWKRTA